MEILVLVLSFFLATIVGLGTYAYTRDMGYLKERLTELSTRNDKDNDIIHSILKNHEERLQKIEKIIHKELE